MGRVSKRTIDRDLQCELEEQLSFIVSCLTDKKEIIVFLNEFLTREEKIMLGKRLVLYIMLVGGTSSKDIHNTLLMSYETIRWYRELYTTKPSVFRKTIDRLLKHEKSKSLLKKLDDILIPLDLVLHSKTNMKARAKFMNGDWK